jgi:hypothetical protein
MNPITGIGDCCACAQSGQETGRAVEKRDELAAPHSIISSARRSIAVEHSQAECLGGPQIDHRLKPSWLQYGQVTWLGALLES